MRKRWQKISIGLTVPVFAGLALTLAPPLPFIDESVYAQASPTPSPAFDQAAALARLREQIKGREQEPAEKVFKNVQMSTMKAMPAARLLAVMQQGYARSLGVNCTHCHVPDKWESDEKPQKDIAREMAGMVAQLNAVTLKGIKNLRSPSPTVNCTTCHRGEIKPALNLAER
jgi:hypothetical protein